MDIYETNTRFHPSNRIHSTAIIHDCVDMGENNVIGAYAVIGGDGEIRGTELFEGRVQIGSNNRISELVTIQRPSTAGAVTKIGDNNIIMAHSHIGHDAVIGSHCEISTGTVIGGYSKIEDGVKLKLNVTIRNRKTVGSGALIGMGSVVVKDVPAGEIYVGNPAKPFGNNEKEN